MSVVSKAVFLERTASTDELASTFLRPMSAASSTILGLGTLGSRGTKNWFLHKQPAVQRQAARIVESFMLAEDRQIKEVFVATATV